MLLSLYFLNTTIFQALSLSIRTPYLLLSSGCFYASFLILSTNFLLIFICKLTIKLKIKSIE